MFGHSTELCIVILLLITLNSLCDVYGSLSGFYIDNGVGQTVLHRALTQDDAQEVEHEILELLGLPERPRKKHNIHPSLRKSAPKFLLDVYKNLNDEANENTNGGRLRRSTDSDEGENFITDVDKAAIEESDIITTFLNKKNHITEVRHERGRKLWFDVSEVSKDSSLMMAELRIFQNPALGRWQDINKDFIITVYFVTNAENDKDLQAIVSTNTTSDYHGWLELNVTDAMVKWILNGEMNEGLYIGAYAVNRPDHEVKLDEIGLVNTKGDDEYQPFMIGYFQGQNFVKPVMHKIRSKRSAMYRRRKSDMVNPLLETRANDHSKSCQIQQLYVSFKDLKWQDWIIAPDGYGAYYCSGECNFPLTAHMNATNHAIVQTLVHLMQPAKVPKPCCAPVRLAPISVLYYLDETNVNLKKYKNMVVKSCGCH